MERGQNKIKKTFCLLKKKGLGHKLKWTLAKITETFVLSNPGPPIFLAIFVLIEALEPHKRQTSHWKAD